MFFPFLLYFFGETFGDFFGGGCGLYTTYRHTLYSAIYLLPVYAGRWLGLQIRCCAQTGASGGLAVLVDAMSPSHPDRRVALSWVPRCLSNRVHPAATSAARLHEQYRSFVFGLSPRGNGVDCHRTWEMLYFGMIPVMLRSTIDQLFDGTITSTLFLTIPHFRILSNPATPHIIGACFGPSAAYCIVPILIGCRSVHVHVILWRSCSMYVFRLARGAAGQVGGTFWPFFQAWA